MTLTTSLAQVQVSWQQAVGWGPWSHSSPTGPKGLGMETGSTPQEENVFGWRHECSGSQEAPGATCYRQTWAHILLFNSLGNLWKVV